MKRYSLSICSLYSLSEKEDFEDEYDTVQELNAMLEELIIDSIAEGLLFVTFLLHATKLIVLYY
jgi:hypothetical protein